MLGFRFPTLPGLLDSGAVYRFLRVIAAAVLTALTAALVTNIGLLELPGYALPIILAAFVALDKAVRDYFARS